MFTMPLAGARGWLTSSRLTPADTERTTGSGQYQACGRYHVWDEGHWQPIRGEGASRLTNERPPSRRVTSDTPHITAWPSNTTPPAALVVRARNDFSCFFLYFTQKYQEEITLNIKINVFKVRSCVCFSSGAASAPSPSSDAPVLLVPVALTPGALDGVQGRVLGGQLGPVPEARGQGARVGDPRGTPGHWGQVGAPPPAQVPPRPRLPLCLRLLEAVGGVLWTKLGQLRHNLEKLFINICIRDWYLVCLCDLIPLVILHAEEPGGRSQAWPRWHRPVEVNQAPDARDGEVGGRAGARTEAAANLGRVRYNDNTNESWSDCKVAD